MCRTNHASELSGESVRRSDSERDGKHGLGSYLKYNGESINTVGYDRSNGRNLELDSSSLANGVSKSELGVQAHCSTVWMQGWD
jgi:hypothetical protein